MVYMLIAPEAQELSVLSLSGIVAPLTAIC